MNMDGLYQVLDRAKFKSLVSYEEISTDAFALVNNSQEKLSDIIKNGTVSRATQDLYFSMRLSQNDGNILLDSIEKGNFQIEMEGMDNKGLIYKLTLMPVTLEICGKTKPEEETVCFPMIAMRLQRNSLQTPVRIA
jgi:hypothetical protein